MAARKVLSGEVDTLPKDTTGVVESICQFKVARASAIKARSAALLALGDVLISAPALVREQLSATTASARATQAARLRHDPVRLSEPTQAAKFALRALARQVGDLDQRISEFDAALAPQWPRPPARPRPCWGWVPSTPPSC